MRSRGLTATFLLATVLLAIASPAVADDGGGAFVDADGNPTATASAGQPGGGGTNSGGSAGTDECRWVVVVEDDFEWALYGPAGNRRFSETGRWLARDCPPTQPGSVGGIVMVPEGEEVDLERLTQEALARTSVGAPQIETSPSANGALYVQMPTWLWVAPSWWQAYEATASAGRVWSTVRATPVTTRWSMGDGQSVSCAGPGTPWRPGMPEGATDCAHTYRTSSATRPEGTFPIEATVSIDVSWTSNAASGGTLPGISRTSTLDVVVGEIQAIGTQGGQ
jgi:hypothetical protein